MEKGFEIKVLDHGYVKLVDWLGSDESIVEAARTSTGRGFVAWIPYRRCKKCDALAPLADNADILEGKTFEDRQRMNACAGNHDWQPFPRGDLGILDYLYKNRHTTPFEMCELIIDVQVPMDHWRQWIRHRTANVNEYSTRYTEAIDLVAATEPDAWRTQGVTNRQGSGAFLPLGEAVNPQDSDVPKGGAYLSRREHQLHHMAREVYEERLAAGVAKEQARKDLPLSTYTAARWKCDLKNTLHFLGLRMHPHAQQEIRLYANAVAEMVKAIWPKTYALFEEYDLGGVHLSKTEAAALVECLDGNVVNLEVYKSLCTKLGIK